MRRPPAYFFLATGLGLLIGLLAVQPSRVAAVIVDDFNDNSIDGSRWNTVADGSGTSTAETNQRLEVTLQANASGALFAGGVRSTCLISGNFDVRVDFDLLTWPANNGVRTVLAVEGVIGLERTSNPGSDVYFTSIGGTVATTDTSGTLRLTRTGSQVSAYYFDGSQFVLLGSGVSSTAPGTLLLQAFSHDNIFGNALTRAAFDDLDIVSGDAPCFSSEEEPPAPPEDDEDESDEDEDERDDAQDEERIPPNLAGLAGAFSAASDQARENRARAAAAGAAAAVPQPSPAPATAIRPPSTGDAGLVGSRRGTDLTPLFALAGLAILGTGVAIKASSKR